jgi:hypothetical protein
MGYHVLIADKLKVAAAEEVNGTYGVVIPALRFLREHEQQPQYHASAVGMKAVFEFYASGRHLPSALFHEVDKQEKIYEFIKGDLRMFCFVLSGGIVLTHGAIKKSQKVDKAEVARAVAARKNFPHSGI